MRTYGTVIIIKEANAADTFTFDEDIPGCAISFEFAGDFDPQTVVCDFVEEDVYTVTEDDPGAGWTVEIDCEDSEPGDASAVDEGAREATIILDGSETVTCTFTNTFTPPPPP